MCILGGDWGEGGGDIGQTGEITEVLFLCFLNKCRGPTWAQVNLKMEKVNLEQSERR